MVSRCSVVALAVVVVLSSAASAQPPPPTAVVVSRAGQVLRLEARGERRVLMTCELRRRSRLLVPPFNELLQAEPCSLESLVTHERLGRWAVAVTVQRFPSTVSETYLVDGQPVVLPNQLSGNFFVFGDARGVTRHAMPPPTAWYDGDKAVTASSPRSFDAAGERVLVSVQAGSRGAPVTWQLPYAGPGQPVRFGGMGEAGLVDGDDVYGYRPGKTMVQGSGSWASTTCDPKAPGTWRRLDRRTGKEEVLLEGDWCRAGSAPYVGERAGARAVILNQLAQDGRRRLYRYDKASRQTTEVAFEESLARTPLAVSADGDLVLALTHQDGLVLLDTRSGALVWRAGELPQSKRGVGDFSGGFVSDDGGAMVRGPFLADGAEIAVGPGAMDLQTGEKMKSFFERRAFGTGHHVVAGVHLAEISNLYSRDVAARFRADVPTTSRGWSLLAAWPASMNPGGSTTLPVTSGAAGSACEPFDLEGTRGARLAFIDWNEGRPAIIACATTGTLTVHAQPGGELWLTADVTFSDGSQLQGTRYALSPVR